MHNYSSPGDEVLITDWHWGAYDSVMIDAGRKVRTFSFLTEDGHFNMESFKENVTDLVEKQYKYGHHPERHRQQPHGLLHER